jgi:regulatory protein
LARRDRASEELRRILVEKGYDREIVAGVIDRLVAEHLLDDRRYVDNFVSTHAARGQGPLRVRAELRKLGLQGELVENCIAAFADWIGQMQCARKKKFGATLPAELAEKERQARFLGYRGFTGAQIRTALGFDTDLQADNEEL